MIVKNIGQGVSQHIILYDGVCGLCNALVAFVIKRDPNRYFKFASLQSAYAIDLLKSLGQDPAALDSIVLVSGNQIAKGSRAAFDIVRRLSGIWPILSLLRWVPARLTDAVYRLIARNRYRIFGKMDACPLPQPSERDRFIGESNG